MPNTILQRQSAAPYSPRALVRIAHRYRGAIIRSTLLIQLTGVGCVPISRVGSLEDGERPWLAWADARRPRIGSVTEPGICWAKHRATYSTTHGASGVSAGEEITSSTTNRLKDVAPSGRVQPHQHVLRRTTVRLEQQLWRLAVVSEVLLHCDGRR